MKLIRIFLEEEKPIQVIVIIFQLCVYWMYWIIKIQNVKGEKIAFMNFVICYKE